MRWRILLVALGSWICSSCAPSGFADPTQIESVRILASSADTPYAKPGSQVTAHVLAYDNRSSKPEPMTISWLKIPCVNPQDDAYYSCFQQFAEDAKDAGAALAGGAFTTGPSASFTVPSNAVTTHPPQPGAQVPYGLVFLFNVACAGQIRPTPIDPSNQNPQAVPIGCFDAQGNQLGPDDWVLGYTRVYAYDTLTNANPVIDHVDVNGQRLSLTQGDAPQIYEAPACDSGVGCLSMSPCTSSDKTNCQVKIGPVVPSSSWELNPEQTDVNGNPLHEEIWADYYSSVGQVQYSARLLYDPSTGSIGGPDKTDNNFEPPDSPSEGYIWIVVHDNRSGAAWVTIPVSIR
ncbi:MAG TPA: hypothetical protein VF765_06820 [Polyangiaceae bacterium]